MKILITLLFVSIVYARSPVKRSGGGSDDSNSAASGGVAHPPIAFPPAQSNNGNGQQQQQQPNQWWLNNNNNGNSGSGGKSGHGKSASAPTNLQQHIQDHRDAAKANMVHAFKVMIPQQTADSLCSLSAADRQCIQNAQKSIVFQWATGNSNINDAAGFFQQLKNACPGAADEIDAWSANSTANQAQAQAQWDAKFSQFPQSVQDFFNTLNSTFTDLRLNHQLVPPNITAIKEGALDVIASYEQISDSDWEAVVALYPTSAVIFSPTGELHGNFTALINALKDYLETGNVADWNAIQTAHNAFKAYGMEQWEANKDSYSTMTQDFQNAPETDVCPELLEEFSDSLDSKLDFFQAIAPMAQAKFAGNNNANN